MTSSPVDPPPDGTNEPRLLRFCPVCGARMETVYERHSQQVRVCVECRTSVMVPGSAWEVVRRHRDKSV
jgi:hypothetical protein